MNSELIDHAFGEATAQGRIALLGYLPAAWPSESGFRECVEAAFLAGLDILEVGLPAEDPFMDGDVIRKAVASVRRRGVSVASALESIIHPEEGTDCCGSNGGSPARVESRAIIAMMYLSSYIELGRADVPRRLAALGYAGLLVVGTDTDTWLEYTPAARSAGVASIGFAGAEAGADGVEALAHDAGGFIYLPSYEGKTGRSANFDSTLGMRIDLVKRSARGLPVAVGFGVNTPADVRALAGLGADGAIVGTSLVRAANDPDRLSKYVASLRAATQRDGNGKGSA